MLGHGLIFWLIIGGIAGWLAGRLMRGGGFGVIGDIVLGVVGGLIGGWCAGALGIHIGGGIIASLLTATAGAVLLIAVVRLIRRGA